MVYLLKSAAPNTAIAIIGTVLFVNGCSLFYSRPVVWYANDNDIDYEVAKYRLSIQGEIAQLNSLLIEDKENFGGLYIQNKPTYSINALFKNTNQTKVLDGFIAEKSWEKFVKTRKVSLSREELRTIRKETHLLMKSLNINCSSSLDIITRQVVIYIPDKEIFERLLARKEFKLAKQVKLILVDDCGHQQVKGSS